MFTAYLVVVVVAAVSNLAAAVADFVRVPWIIDNMSSYGLPHSWLPMLGVAKAAGGLGLLAGIAVPLLGVAAATGLVLYFVGAVVTVVRARRLDHLPFPGVFLLLGVGSLVLRLAVP
ncbi:DoxX family protein [Actinophytocola xanthii]|uniref:DoxX family protein n=1 Tax=Actinophytocola xanthii TaxID=1912961 RepID=A0A1Q8CPD6_9PSEU|nr:DoxX family protein [Actinophytocola xanthii]OLF16229.1 hypothetical protein BU204_17835 [Actinophytocola xanthii]